MSNREFTKNAFPIGFNNDLHKDFSVNFQMNRFYNWTNDEFINILYEYSDESNDAVNDLCNGFYEYGKCTAYCRNSGGKTRHYKSRRSSDRCQKWRY